MCQQKLTEQKQLVGIRGTWILISSLTPCRDSLKFFYALRTELSTGTAHGFWAGRRSGEDIDIHATFFIFILFLIFYFLYFLLIYPHYLFNFFHFELRFGSIADIFLFLSLFTKNTYSYSNINLSLVNTLVFNNWHELEPPSLPTPLLPLCKYFKLKILNHSSVSYSEILGRPSFDSPSRILLAHFPAGICLCIRQSAVNICWKFWLFFF